MSNKSKYWELKPETVYAINALRDMTIQEISEKLARGERVIPSISKGNHKIGACLNVSTMPGMCCGNCAHCIRGCYAMKSANQHRNSVIPAWTKNAVLIKLRMKEFFAELWRQMKARRKHFYVRFHVSGDLQVWKGTEIDNKEYLSNIVITAKMFPNYQIWTYTKMYSLVNSWVAENGMVPSNLHIMFSQWGTDDIIDNPYGFPVYLTVLPGQEFPENVWRCPGNCDLCKKEHSKDGKDHGCIAGESACIGAHN